MNRWIEESDLEPFDLAEIAAKVFNDWLEEPEVDFESDVFGEEDDDPELPG